MLQLKRLKVRNFRSYGNTPTELNFENTDLALITAKNGAGKSTFFSTAPYFAIFGENPNGKKNDLINDVIGKNLETECDLYDSETGKTYTIKRTLKPDTNTILIDGKEIDAGMYKGDFDKYITDLLKIDKQFFNKFINNNIVNGMNFLSAPKGEKMKIFEYVFDLNKITEMKKRIADKNKEITTSISGVESKISTDRATLKGKQDNLEFIEEELSGNIEYVKNLEQTLKDEKIALKEDKVRSRNEIRDLLEKIRELSKIDYANISSEHSLAKTSYEKLKNDFSFKLSSIEIKNKSITKSNDEILAIENKILDSKNNLKKFIEQAKTEREEIRSVNGIDNTAKIKDLRDKAKEIKTKLAYEEKHRTDLKKTLPKEETIKECEKIDVSCSVDCIYRNTSSVKTVLEIQKKIKDMDKSINKLNKELESLELDISEESKIEEAFLSNKGRIENFKNNMLKLKDAWNKYRTIKSTLELKKTELKLHKEEVENLELHTKELDPKMKEAEKTYKVWEEKFDEAKSADLKKQGYLKQLKIHWKAYDKLKKNNNEGDKKLEEHKQKTNRLLDKVKALQDDIKLSQDKIIEQEKKLNELLREEKYTSFLLKNVMDSSQIVKYIVDSNIKIIETLVNSFLKRFQFPNTLKLDFGKDLELKFSNGREYEEFSDGQKLRIKMSFVFAFLFFLKQLSKNNLSLLVLDEILSSSADDDMIDEVFKILDELKENMLIAVISHDDRLKDRFKKTYVVEHGLFSRIKEVI